MRKTDYPHILIEKKFQAPIEQVFELLSKHATYNQAFAPIQVERIHDSTDQDNPDGLGSIRRMGFGPVKPLQEQISLVEPNVCIEYKIIRNPLVKYHLGRLDFQSLDDGSTLVHYRIDLQLRVPMLTKLVLAQLKQSIQRGFSKLSRSFV
jgi:uncharacterized protein YndB with AHSA1/START domain